MSELSRLTVLTADAVDELRGLADSRPGELWASRFDDLVERHGLKLIETDYEINSSVTLHRPEPGARGENYDAQNSHRALRILPHLTRADATDERIWVTLALREFSEYTHERWRFNAGGRATLSGHLRNHIFAATMRTRERDQAISRLWWTGDYVRRLVGADALADSLRALYANSEIPVQLLGRPNIATHPNVGRAVLSLCRAHFGEDPSRFDRPAFRAFLTDIDLIAGRSSLGAMTEEAVLALLEERFKEEFGISS